MKTLILLLISFSCFACEYNDTNPTINPVDTVKVLLPGDPDEGGPPQEPDSWVPPEPEQPEPPPGDPQINDPDNPNDDE